MYMNFFLCMMCMHMFWRIQNKHSLTRTPCDMDKRTQVHPTQVKKNGDAHHGDVLILSKPIGVGVLSAALKKQMLEDEGYKTLLKWTCKVMSQGRSACASVYTHAYKLHAQLHTHTHIPANSHVHIYIHTLSSTRLVSLSPRCPASMPSQTSLVSGLLGIASK